MQSIGERLEEARKRKGISIREASEATKIRGEYLHKFESNQFDIRLPEIYVRGFIRTYANYLKVPADKIVSDYNGLGLSDNNRGQRTLNREVYGRMDLSVSSAKAEKEASSDTAPVIESSEKPEAVAAKNPATFIPKSTGGSSLQIDRGLLIKAGGFVGAVLLLVFILVYAFSGRGAKTPPAVPPSSDITWVRPQPGESSLALVAVDRVQVTATQTATGRVVYQGTIPRGDRREIPYQGELRINSDIPANLRVNIDGRDWPLQDPKTNAYLSSAIIQGRSR
ncbi:MAG TPA: helix-turn-helix domain-containing protein [Opitutaceae bacterium]|nr:helix-turn-helix domain-containing protein [Opitutaceae bacterium]